MLTAALQAKHASVRHRGPLRIGHAAIHAALRVCAGREESEGATKQTRENKGPMFHRRTYGRAGRQTERQTERQTGKTKGRETQRTQGGGGGAYEVGPRKAFINQTVGYWSPYTRDYTVRVSGVTVLRGKTRHSHRTKVAAQAILNPRARRKRMAPLARVPVSEVCNVPSRTLVICCCWARGSTDPIPTLSPWKVLETTAVFYLAVAVPAVSSQQSAVRSRSSNACTS